jgi:hypothetical protein
MLEVSLSKLMVPLPAYFLPATRSSHLDPRDRISIFLLKSMNSPKSYGVTFQEILLLVRKWNLI